MSTSSDKTTAKLREYSLSVVAIATGAALLPQQAEAAIVTFADSGSFIEGTVDDGDQATIDISLADGSTLSLDTDISPTTFGMGLSGSSGLWDHTDLVYTGKYWNPIPSVLGAGININPTDPSGVITPNIGMPIGGGTTFGDWTTAFTDQYVGFQTSVGNKGYLKVSWNPVSGLFSYNGGAIEDTGADLLTGASPAAVPAPSALILFCTGLVGLARRRVQQQQVAMA